jgi:hypothetical protein
VRERASSVVLHLYAAFVVVHVVLYVVSIPLSARGGLLAAGVNRYLGFAALVPYVAALPVGVALSLDRRVVRRNSDWTPGWWYYGMCLPNALTVLLSVVYVYRRHLNAPSVRVE